MRHGRRNIDIYAIVFIYLFKYVFIYSFILPYCTYMHSRHKVLIGNFKSSSVTDYLIFSYIKVAIIFACTKVLQDVAYAYLPLFLIYSVDFGKVSVHNYVNVFFFRPRRPSLFCGPVSFYAISMDIIHVMLTILKCYTF